MDHLELSQKADQKVIVYLKRFVKDFKAMKNEIDYQKSVSQDKVRQVESQIEMKMKDYNNEYNIGFENSLKISKVIRQDSSIERYGYCF